ncbi:hypothetical protein [Butyrivibrio sp. LC3010]|uniref:hypothetical protein n=1 Tax=Butyrivibrio sp. LC3010 TaxID=1280680 RepID=UPI000423C01D|nr:hypothetical protein [Butyrivibrio sp. LC3010]
MNNTEMIPNDNQSQYPEKDRLRDAERVLNYLEDHPGTGFILGGTFTAGGIGAMIYYGSKLITKS